MLLDFSLENESQGDGGGEHPQNRVNCCGNAEGTGAAHALLEVLDVEAQTSGYADARDIEASDDAMELGEAAAEPFRTLHRDEQQGAGGHQAGRQKPPSERLDVRPLAI